MNLEIIREKVKEFRPFTVITWSGNSYPIPHPDFIFLAPRAVVVVTQRGNPVSIDPLHIVSLKDIPLRKNGKHKRRRNGH